MGLRGTRLCPLGDGALPHPFREAVERPFLVEPPKVNHIGGELHVIPHAWHPLRKLKYRSTKPRRLQPPKTVYERGGVQAIGDVLKVGIVVDEGVDVVELRTVASLKPGKNVQSEVAHRHCKTPFAGFFRPSLFKTTSKVGLRTLLEELGGPSHNVLRADRVLGVNHPGLDPW